jgi:hypothetical protein
MKQFTPLPNWGNTTFLGGIQIATDLVSILLLVVFSASLALQWVAHSSEEKRFL